MKYCCNGVRFAVSFLKTSAVRWQMFSITEGQRRNARPSGEDLVVDPVGYLLSVFVGLRSTLSDSEHNRAAVNGHNDGLEKVFKFAFDNSGGWQMVDKGCRRDPSAAKCNRAQCAGFLDSANGQAM